MWLQWLNIYHQLNVGKVSTVQKFGISKVWVQIQYGSQIWPQADHTIDWAVRGADRHSTLTLPTKPLNMSHGRDICTHTEKQMPGFTLLCRVHHIYIYHLVGQGFKAWIKKKRKHMCSTSFFPTLSLILDRDFVCCQERAGWGHIMRCALHV